MDNLFVKAITIAAKTETYYCVSMPAPEWSLSEETEKTILGYADRKEKKRLAPRQLIAILIAAALLVALSITAYAYREQIGNLIESIFDDHINLTPEGQSPTPNASHFYPEYLPAGYEVSYESKTALYDKLIWNRESKEIILEVYKTTNVSINLDRENSTYTVIDLDDVTVHYIVNNKTYYLNWLESNMLFELTCPEELGLEEIEKIIRSIEPVEDAGK